MCAQWVWRVCRRVCSVGVVGVQGTAAGMALGEDFEASGKTLIILCVVISQIAFTCRAAVLFMRNSDANINNKVLTPFISLLLSHLCLSFCLSVCLWLLFTVTLPLHPAAGEFRCQWTRLALCQKGWAESRRMRRRRQMQM